MAGDLMALAVDQQRGRQAVGPKVPGRLGGGVDVAAEMLHPGLGMEPVDGAHAGPVDGQGDDLEVRSAECGLQAVERRHLLAARAAPGGPDVEQDHRSEEHTSELQSLMHISYAVFCLKKKKNTHNQLHTRENIIYIRPEHKRARSAKPSDK